MVNADKEDKVKAAVIAVAVDKTGRDVTNGVVAAVTGVGASAGAGVAVGRGDLITVGNGFGVANFISKTA